MRLGKSDTLGFWISTWVVSYEVHKYPERHEEVEGAGKRSEQLLFVEEHAHAVVVQAYWHWVGVIAASQVGYSTN